MQKDSKYKTTDIFLAAVLVFLGFSHELEKVDNTVIFVFSFHHPDPTYATYKDVGEALSEYEGGCLVIADAAGFKECHENVRGELYDLVKGRRKDGE